MLTRIRKRFDIIANTTLTYIRKDLFPNVDKLLFLPHFNLKHGQTALHLACIKDKREVIQVMLEMNESQFRVSFTYC